MHAMKCMNIETKCLVPTPEPILWMLVYHNHFQMKRSSFMYDLLFDSLEWRRLSAFSTQHGSRIKHRLTSTR